MDALLTPRDAELYVRERGFAPISHVRLGQLVRAGKIPARRTRSGIWVIEERDLVTFLQAREQRRATHGRGEASDAA